MPRPTWAARVPLFERRRPPIPVAGIAPWQAGRGKEAAMRLKDMLADGVRVGPDDVIDIGAVRDAAGGYRRGTTTLREIANLVLDELAARGVPIPPAPPKPMPEPAPEPEAGVTPLVARVLERHRRVLPTEDTICEIFGGRAATAVTRHDC